MKQADKLLCFLEEAFVSIGIVAAAFVLFINVVMRYGFNHGWVWAEEFARYGIVWIVFVGSSICVRKRLHLVVDAVTIRLSAKNQALITFCVCVLGVLFSLFLVWYGYKVCDKLFVTGQRLAGLGILTGYAYLAIPVGGFLMAVRFFQQCLIRFAHLRNPEAPLDTPTLNQAA